MYYTDTYIIESPDTPLTADLLLEWLAQHERAGRRYRMLKDFYEGNHSILRQPKKEDYKPDNRIVANYAKYIVDTLNGFFIGIPVKTVCSDKTASVRMEEIQKHNDQDDNNAELSKICSIYGRGCELLYTDEDAEVCITYLTPLEGFVVYDDSIARKPLYAVRYYWDKYSVMHGSIYTRELEIPFTDKDGLHFLEETPHYFDGVPMIEYIENEECTGAFEHVISQIEAYSKAISEKANDVDYFADAYPKILGATLDEESMQQLRRNRIINLTSEITDQLVVDFLQKPSADTTQENLLERLQKDIFTISMVANISDKEFGNATGVALAYKLLAMSNLCAMKSRKFASGMNQRWKLIASHPASKLPADCWKALEYRFTPNVPKNLLEEVQTAAQMSGITSRETQLKVISAVEDVQQEMDQIQLENGGIPEDAMRTERVTDEHTK